MQGKLSGENINLRNGSVPPGASPKVGSQTVHGTPMLSLLS